MTKQQAGERRKQAVHADLPQQQASWAELDEIRRQLEKSEAIGTDVLEGG